MSDDDIQIGKNGMTFEEILTKYNYVVTGRTFDMETGEQVGCEVLSAPGSTGLMKVRLETGKEVVRHVQRVTDVKVKTRE